MPIKNRQKAIVTRLEARQKAYDSLKATEGYRRPGSRSGRK